MISMAEGDVRNARLLKRGGNTVGIVRIKMVGQALVATKEAEALLAKLPPCHFKSFYRSIPLVEV